MSFAYSSSHVPYLAGRVEPWGRDDLLPESNFSAIWPEDDSSSDGTVLVGEPALGRGCESTSRWDANFEKINRLEAGWDGYGAEAPSRVAIDLARCFVAYMEVIDFHPTRVAPSVVGGVGVTRKLGERRVYFEFYNDGTAHAMFAEGEDAKTFPLEMTVEDICSKLTEAENYLNGREAHCDVQEQPPTDPG